MDYVDLYLVHWPVVGLYKETWRAVEDLYKDGRVRAIGVCNFLKHQLEDLMAEAEEEISKALKQYPYEYLTEEMGWSDDQVLEAFGYLDEDG